MKEYHKINSVFKRDEKTKKFTAEYADPVFEYLKDNVWEFTEKVDGTNIRIIWDHEQKKVLVRGRTDEASIPTFLLERLVVMFPPELMGAQFPDSSVCLYGEGYGNKIQSAGKLYNPKETDFVLFDVRIGMFWLKRADVEDIAGRLGIKVVPIIGEGTLEDAIRACQQGFMSTWGAFPAEGIVARPKCPLLDRDGSRIITKIKLRDFK